MAVTASTGGGGTSAAEQAGAGMFAAAPAGGGSSNSIFGVGSNIPSNQPLVYLGTSYVEGDDKYGPVGRHRAVPNWATPDDAYSMWFQMSGKQRSDIIAKGIIGGQLQSDAGLMEGEQLWKNLVASSARFGAAGQQYGPLDILNSYVSAAGYGMTDKQRRDAGKGNFPNGAIFDAKGKYTNTYRDGDFVVDQISGKRTYVGPKFKTQSQQQTDLTDPNTAHALVTSIFQQMLGRDPGSGELTQFASALADAERNNPVTVTQTDEYNSAGDVVNTTSQRTGGLDQAGKQYLLEQQAKANPEYGATQAATTYMGALEKAIWGGPA